MKGWGSSTKYLRTCNPWLCGRRLPPLQGVQAAGLRVSVPTSPVRAPQRFKARGTSLQPRPLVTPPRTRHARPRPPRATGRAWGERAWPISGRATASLGPRLGPRRTPDSGSGSGFTRRAEGAEVTRGRRPLTR